MRNWDGKHGSNPISSSSTWPDGRLLGWRMKGFGVFLPNDEDENALLCGFNSMTFAQVEETETRHPFIHCNGHFPSPNHLIFVPIIGRQLIIEPWIRSCTCFLADVLICCWGLCTSSLFFMTSGWKQVSTIRIRMSPPRPTIIIIIRVFLGCLLSYLAH